MDKKFTPAMHRIAPCADLSTLTLLKRDWGKFHSLTPMPLFLTPVLPFLTPNGLFLTLSYF